MKLHKIELIIVDSEDYKLSDILVDLACGTDAMINCVSSETVDVGEDYWSDDNIINQRSATSAEVLAEYESAKEKFKNG
jgi:hypothetical protein